MGAGVKFSQADWGEGWRRETLSASDPIPGCTVPAGFTAAPGPRFREVPAPGPAGWADLCAAPAHPFPCPPPSPSRALGPRQLRPRPRRGRCSARGCPELPGPGAPALCQPGQRLGGSGAGQRRRLRQGPPARELCRPGRRPRLWEPERKAKARTGRPAEGRAPLISHASHVWGHPAAFFLLSPRLSPPPLLARAKWWRRRHARAGVSARGRKWRTSR